MSYTVARERPRTRPAGGPSGRREPPGAVFAGQAPPAAGVDFGRVPVWPRRSASGPHGGSGGGPGGGRAARGWSGESESELPAGGQSPEEDRERLSVTGDGGTSADAGTTPTDGGTAPAGGGSAAGGGGAPAGGGAGGGGAAAATPQLKKTTVSGPTTQNNGGFSWGVQWSIDNATASTDGWIVQSVFVGQSVHDSAGTAVIPGSGTNGGLSLSWYPLWEAWQVRGGRVFIGGSTSAHHADTYAQGPVAANTTGGTAIVGSADFYPNLTLPAAFTVKNAAPAWALPSTNTNPGLSGGTGALTHDLTAGWNSVTGTGATTVTTA
jgi:hypothetical protein